jgi:hypothetical protein
VLLYLENKVFNNQINLFYNNNSNFLSLFPFNHSIFKANMATKTNKTSSRKTITKKKKSRKTTSKSLTKSVFRSDSRQTASLVKVGRTSAAKAIRESKALGLSIIYMQKGVLYKEKSDGQVEVLESVTKRPKSKSSLVLKKGMIFHAKK